MTSFVRFGRSASGGESVGRRPLLLALVGLSVTGCPSSTTPTIDAGHDAPVAETDAPSLDAPAALDTPAALDAPAPIDAGDDAATTDGPILASPDTGDPFGDAGALGPPEWVPIDVLTTGTCDPLVACGGDEVGTWDVEGACFELPAPGALSLCPGATFVASGMARGRVTFTGTVAVRTAQSLVTVDVFVPTACATIAGGCSAIETMVRAQVPDSSCITEATGCRCSGRQQLDIDDADAYTIDTTTDEIVSTSSGKRWAYCVADGSLRYEDTSPSGGTPREPGIIELGAR